MSWRANTSQTGSNTIPLGKRRFGGDDAPGEAPIEEERGRSTEITERKAPELNPDGTKKRRKRNRWGDASENKAAGLMNLPTAITAAMTQEQIEAYVLHLRIEEISQKLRINDVVPADGDRSPSPPPQYDNFGRRVNTREYRYKKKLEDERHTLVEQAMREIPSYHPPADYRRPVKTQEKVYVPVNDYPEINFIGLLIGPRGNTLKTMEKDSGAKIAIRGKGSVKEGKGKSDAAHASNQDEDLHCLIMGDTEEKVNKAKELIHNVIETAASIPESHNTLKRNQLRELAALNGTLRDDENQACQNCGEIGHRKYDCPQTKNFTANVICRVCGNAGHFARDCPDRARGADYRNLPPPRSTMQNDLDRLMDDFDGKGPSNHSGRQIGWDEGARDSNGPPTGGPAPWATGGATGGPAPWSRPQNTGGSSAAPWANRGPPSNNYDAGSGGGGGGPAPWARGGGSGGGGGGGGGAAPWQSNNNQNHGGYQSHGSYGQSGHGGNGYGQQGYGNQGSRYGSQGNGGQDYGYQDQRNQNYGSHGRDQPPPPPPPADLPPPPPPSDIPPPPPPA